MMGISKPTLYYDFNCTSIIEEKDGMHVIDLGYVSNKVKETTINICVKNEGTHKAYDLKISNFVGDVISSNVIRVLEPNEVKNLYVKVGKGSSNKVMVVFKYDNI